MTPKEMKVVETAMAYVLPWGIYRGKTLDDVKSSYLRILAESCHDQKVAEYADALWQWREEMDVHT